MKVYFYVGFWGMKRIDGEIVYWYSNIFGQARAVIKIEKTESESYEHKVGRFVTVYANELYDL